MLKLNQSSFRAQGQNKSYRKVGQGKSGSRDGKFRLASIFKMSVLYKKAL